MRESIKKIQTGISEILSKRNELSFFVESAGILIFAKPIHSLLYLLPYNRYFYTVLSWTEAIVYILSLIGLLACFAKNDLKKVGIYFILRAIPNFLNIFRGYYSFTLSTLIYLAFYILLAVLALMNSNVADDVYTASTPNVIPTLPHNNTSSARVCSKCGAQLKPDAVFCTSCGAKIE